MRGRLRAIQEGFELAMEELRDEARSKEMRQWIKLAHEVTERRDLEREVQKLLASMESERVAAERGKVGTPQGDDEGEAPNVQ